MRVTACPYTNSAPLRASRFASASAIADAPPLTS
jgi:hypothetical protein